MNSIGLGSNARNLNADYQPWQSETTAQDSSDELPVSLIEEEYFIQEQCDSCGSDYQHDWPLEGTDHGKTKVNELLVHFTVNPLIHPLRKRLLYPEINHTFNTNDDQQIPSNPKKRSISRKRKPTKIRDNERQMEINRLRSEGKEKEAEKAEKKLKRLLKNRKAAEKSRERKRVRIEELENKISQLEKKNMNLQISVTAQNSKMEVLKDQVVWTMKQALLLIPELLPNLNVCMLSQDPLVAARQFSAYLKANPINLPQDTNF